MLLRLVLLLTLCSPCLAVGLSTRLSQVDAGRFPSIGVTLGVFTDEGRPVPGLTRDDFTMAEDSKPVKLLSVEVEKAPLTIALVLDMSGSMAPALDNLKAAVAGFVRELEPSDRVLLITFSEKPRVREEMTADKAVVLERVEKLETEGATALYDAIAEAAAQLRRVQGRRLAVIFTDGRDQNAAGTANQSVSSATSAAKSAKLHQVPLWTIGLGTQVDRKLLEKLALITGGGSYTASQASELRRAFAEVLTDVRLQYRLTYETPKPQRDGTLRKLTVVSATRGKSGQGSIEYQAPAPEPPPEPPAAPVAVAGASGTGSRRGPSGGRLGRGSLGRSGAGGPEGRMDAYSRDAVEDPDERDGRLLFAGYITPGWVIGAWPADQATGAPFAQIDFRVTRELPLPAGKWRLVIQNHGGRVIQHLDLELYHGTSMHLSADSGVGSVAGTIGRNSSVRRHAGSEPAPNVPIAETGPEEKPPQSWSGERGPVHVPVPPINTGPVQVPSWPRN